MALAATAVQWGACAGATAPAPVPPALPTSFAPLPALAAPAPVDDGVLGAGYLVQVGASLQPRWGDFLDDLRLRLPPEHPLNHDRLQVVVALSLTPAGALVEAEVQQSSGQKDFDRAALEVVGDAQPFTAAPSDLVSDDGVVRLRWSFARDRRQAGAATARVDVVRWPLARSIPELIGVGKLAVAIERVAHSDEPAQARVEQLDAVAMAVIRQAFARGVARSEAVRAAGRAHLVELLPQLRLALEAEVTLRPSAAEALAVVGDDALVLELTRGSDVEVARIAARGLQARGRSQQASVEAARRLERGSDPVALAVLAEVPSALAAPTLASLALRGDKAVRLAALAALARLADTASPPASVGKALRQAAGDRDAAIRRAACRAMAAPGLGRSALRAAVRGLDDPDTRVRGACVVAVARLDPRGFPRRLPGIAGVNEGPVQLGIARALRGRRDPDALARLSSLSESGDPEVRRAVAVALEGRDESESGAVLDRLASDGDVAVRRAAVGALRSPERLKEALADVDLQTQLVALARLASLQGRAAALEAATKLLETDDPARRVAVSGTWLATRVAGR